MNKLVFIFILAAFASRAEETISITDACKKGLISCRFIGNPNSTHYLSPVIGTIQNLKNKTLSLKMENGRTLIANDSLY